MASRPRTDGAASCWVVQQQVTAAAGEDAAAYLKRKEDRRIDVAFSAVGLFELQLACSFVFVLAKKNCIINGYSLLHE